MNELFRKLRRCRWRRLLSCGFVFLAVMLTVFNLASDQLVSRYERDAARDPGSPFLKGMSPRTLGPADCGRAVLFIHGFTGGQSNFHDLPDRVAAEGWYVRTMCLPGHGTSPRDFERTSADDMTAGVLEEVRNLKAEFATVVLVGHSMGGALATLVAAEEKVDGLVLCSPFFGLSLDQTLGIPTAGIIRSAATLLRWVPGRPGHGPVNKVESRPFIDAYEWIPSRGGLAALELCDRANAPEVLRRVQAPLLLIHSRADTVTSPLAAGTAVDRMASTSREIIWLEKSDHVIFWDYEESTVVDSVLRYLKEVEHHDPDQPSIRE